MTKGTVHPLGGPDRTLLETWARDFGPALHTFFRKRVSTPSEADDLVQDVFVRLARRADLASIEKAEGYIFRTARTALAEYYRKRASQHPELHEPFDEDQHLMAGISQETVLSDREAMERLIAGLYELPERTRDIYVLYHFEGIKQMQIAEQMQLGMRTIERHLADANSYLLKRVGRHT